MPRDHDPHFTDFRHQRPLCEHPSEVVELVCTRCPRKGRLSRSKLIAEHGADIGLVTLLNYLSRDCPQAKPDFQGVKQCGAHYVGLT